MTDMPAPAAIHLDSKSIDSWTDLRHYGINLLTAEACGIGMRLLIDLTRAGLLLVQEFLGTELMTGNSWNSGAVASIMLPPEMFEPLAVWCLLTEFPQVLVLKYNTEYGPPLSISGHMDGDWFNQKLDRVKELAAPERRYITYWRLFDKHGTAPGGTRNTHQWSGRTY